MRESGLYTKWILDVLEFYREQIGSIDKKAVDIVFEFNVIELSTIMDIFYILYIGIISIIHNSIIRIPFKIMN